MEKKIIEKIKTYLNSSFKKIQSDQKKQLVFFILGFVFFYLVISGIVLIFPAQNYKAITGASVQLILGAVGINTTSVGLIDCTETNWVGIENPSKCYSFFALGNNSEQKQIIISWLCTGILEIIVLCAALLASFGVNWEKKIIGVVIAVIVGVIFNLLRLFITVNLILSQNVQTVELAHDLLFRIILFIYIVAFYVVWFNWAILKKTPSKKHFF